MLKKLNMKVEMRITMTREECEAEMKEFGVTWDDFETEEDCFCEMGRRVLGYSEDEVEVKPLRRRKRK